MNIEEPDGNAENRGETFAELLGRDADGSATLSERRRVSRWLEENATLPEPEPEAFEGIDRTALGASILRAAKGLDEATRAAPEPRSPFGFWKIAAALALMTTVGYLGRDPLFRFADRGLHAAITRDMRETRTANGQKAVLTLSDGTTVHLNAGSVLRHPQRFARTFREVELEGQAFFEVAPDTRRPFTVRTATTTTTVLGTVFDVRAYPQEKRTAVSVREGKVRFAAGRGNATPLLLTAGTSGTHRPDADDLVFVALGPGEFPVWHENLLAFTDAPLSEIAPELERWYDVRVDIRSTESARRLFTGSYRHPDLGTLAREISLATGVRHLIDSRTLIFY